MLKQSYCHSNDVVSRTSYTKLREGVSVCKGVPRARTNLSFARHPAVANKPSRLVGLVRIEVMRGRGRRGGRGLRAITIAPHKRGVPAVRHCQVEEVFVLLWRCFWRVAVTTGVSYGIVWLWVRLNGSHYGQASRRGYERYGVLLWEIL